MHFAVSFPCLFLLSSVEIMVIVLCPFQEEGYSSTHSQIWEVGISINQIPWAANTQPPIQPEFKVDNTFLNLWLSKRCKCLMEDDNRIVHSLSYQFLFNIFWQNCDNYILPGIFLQGCKVPWLCGPHESSCFQHLWKYCTVLLWYPKLPYSKTARRRCIRCNKTSRSDV